MNAPFEDLESPIDGEPELAVPVDEMSPGSEGVIGESPFAKQPDREAETMPGPSLYERLGGVFAIAAVIDRFSDAVVRNPIVGQESENPALREWGQLCSASGMGWLSAHGERGRAQREPRHARRRCPLLDELWLTESELSS